MESLAPQCSEYQPCAQLPLVLQAFADIKNYYNDITHNNLDLIKTLKEDVAEMKKKEGVKEEEERKK